MEPLPLGLSLTFLVCFPWWLHDPCRAICKRFRGPIVHQSLLLARQYMRSYEKSGSTWINHALTLCLEQEGSEEDDGIWAVAGGADGSVVLAGYTLGNWNATNEGDMDYAVVKLDSEGHVLWRWQVMSERMHVSMDPRQRESTFRSF